MTPLRRYPLTPSPQQLDIVAIDELPETAETLWLRILGRGATQEQAIREVLALPAAYPRRNLILRLLASWKVRIDISELMNFTEREEIMALSEAFLAWERETQDRSQQAEARTFVLRLLGRKFGQLPDHTLDRIDTLSTPQLESLGEALLDFSLLDDLTVWLQNHQYSS
jgi:Domain of unknown function (DUF4351)